MRWSSIDKHKSLVTSAQCRLNAICCWYRRSNKFTDCTLTPLLTPLLSLLTASDNWIKITYTTRGYVKLHKSSYPAIHYLTLSYNVLYYTRFSGLVGGPQWLTRSGCGSKLRDTGLESQTGRVFVIGVVHIQGSKLFKGLEYAVLSMVLCTINNP